MQVKRVEKTPLFEVGHVHVRLQVTGSVKLGIEEQAVTLNVNIATAYKHAYSLAL
jgi:hypothetical protein